MSENSEQMVSAREAFAEFSDIRGFAREELSYGGTHENHHANRAEWTHVIVPNTSWGDYSGSTYDRSNCRSILRDYPDYVESQTGGHGSEWLVIDLDTDIPESLIDGLISLADYPLWDESDHSELEMEMATEAWDDFWSREFSSQVEDDIRAELKEWTSYEPVHTYMRECIDADAMRTWFFEPYYDGDSYPYAESATDMVFPGWRDNAKRVAGIVIARYRQEWEDYASQLTTAEYLSKCTEALF